ncbi:related to Alpha-1,3-mannosyltransferase [Ustilago trichophora]|uniref:Dol-P-Man:Man(5)GlcNAc(2)-PP-Dol alpha-1,3-mannosyltransferase n=1 Tax=Ustilago trichophora TaxID=86804 RepID=A0A5C3EPQ7_9BASI|nr:related to Alpha-1,3-mannosyltransferase [Ustilago trichophora]
MQPSSAVAWLRRVCLEDYGYTFALPALTIASVVLSQLVIRRISFTEIDFQTYVGQAALFLDGERDYAKLDPEGGSGPCVYPAVHLYVYSFFHWLTDGGKNILPAQNVFAALATATNLIVALLYRQAGMPPIAVLPLILSKRMHSIFLLRMFNDPISILLVYLALYAAVDARWKVSALLFSVGLGIKMNVLLFLPGIAAAAFVYTGLTGAVSYISIIALVQAAISLPFTMHDAHKYFTNAFDFSRIFLYVWTVNWRFIPEETFLSQHFAKGLLGLHLLLIALFGLFRWTAIGTNGPKWIFQNLSTKPTALSRSSKIAILCCTFTSNVVGILCSRSLHYQFYSWYFHQVPLLLWFSKLPVAVKLMLPMALEWCWNVFPSTETSSTVLLACHVLLVLGCFTLPSLVTNKGPIDSTAREEEEDEVDNLLSTDDQRLSRKQAFNADAETASFSDSEETSARREEALQRLAEARQVKAVKEAKLREAFQRRIATRRRVLALLGHISLLLRPLLVVLGIALIFVVPHPQSPVSKGTYVDENALQPGQARVYWDYFDVTYADMLSEKVAFLSGASSAERADFVYSELQSYGLQANRQPYQHDISLQGKDSALAGINVYARSATPRIDGREALILTASWRSRWQGHDDPFAPADNATETSTIDARGRINVRGVASVLALARYLSTQAHLSKDLIFVVSDGHLEGIHAWSSAYFGSVPDGLKVDPVSAGGSQVWNAISIDYPADSFSALEVQYEGFDGQLPNMDVINTVVRIADSVAGGMPVRFGANPARSLVKEPLRNLARKWGVRLRSDVEYELGNYEAGVRSALRQVGFGVSGQSSGPHGFFQRHHIDAITLYAVPAAGPYGFFHMGRLIESFVRSMSNLLERLHHSQFFYLLLNPRRFVPIGTAILIPLFLSISLTISGLAMWFAEEKVSKQKREAVLSSLGPAGTGESDVQPETPTLGWYRDQVVKKYLALSGGEEKVEQKLVEHADALRESMRPIGATLACVISTILVGVAALYNCEVLFLETGGTHTKRAYDVVLYRTVFIVFPIVGAGILRSRCTRNHARRIGSLLLAFAYLQAGMLVAILSVLNFALATLLALLAYAALRIGVKTPSLSSLQPIPFSWLGSLRGPSIVLFHPVVATWIIGLKVHLDIETLMTHWRLFKSATVPIVCVAYLPIILQAQVGVILRG